MNSATITYQSVGSGPAAQGSQQVHGHKPGGGFRGHHHLFLIKLFMYYCTKSDWTNAIIMTFVSPPYYVLVRHSATVLCRSMGSGPDVQWTSKGSVRKPGGGLEAILTYPIMQRNK